MVVMMMAMRLLLLLQRGERLLCIAEIARFQILFDLLERLCEWPGHLGCRRCRQRVIGAVGCTQVARLHGIGQLVESLPEVLIVGGPGRTERRNRRDSHDSRSRPGSASRDESRPAACLAIRSYRL